MASHKVGGGTDYGGGIGRLLGVLGKTFLLDPYLKKKDEERSLELRQRRLEQNEAIAIEKERRAATAQEAKERRTGGFLEDILGMDLGPEPVGELEGRATEKALTGTLPAEQPRRVPSSALGRIMDTRAQAKELSDKRSRELESLLEIGGAYGEEWDFNSPEAARAYYEGPFMAEQKREREEVERHRNRQALVGGLTRQGMDPADAETHADIAETYPRLYSTIYPRSKTDDGIRQRIEKVEDQLFDQIPDYFEMRDEDRMALISQADSYNRRGIAWRVRFRTDAAGRKYPVVVRDSFKEPVNEPEVEVEEPSFFESTYDWLTELLGIGDETSPPPPKKPVTKRPVKKKTAESFKNRHGVVR